MEAEGIMMRAESIGQVQDMEVRFKGNDKGLELG